MEDLRDVSPLARPGISSVGTTLVSPPLQRGLCFFPHPTPAVPWVTLTCHCPSPSGVWAQENNGVDSLIDVIGRGRVVPLGRWRVIRGGETLKSPRLATHLLVTACQQLMCPFWLFEHHGL